MRYLRFALFGLVVVSGLYSSAADRTVVDLSGPGWQLWHDAAAPWRDDSVHFPAPPLAQLPVNPPTGGWSGPIAHEAIAVSVPGTVEEYQQRIPGPDGDLTGVSWWKRTVEIPANAQGRRVRLRFDAVRERAEVFVDRRLVAYDVVGSTPFEADITDFVQAGETCELAVRVTDPGGNFDWRDSRPMPWGSQQLPLSHGFGGVTGGVDLVVCDPVYLDDLHIQNTPEPTTADVVATVRNTSRAAVRRDLLVTVSPRTGPGREVFRTVLRDVALAPGDNTVTVRIEAPGARLWSPEEPQLHLCRVSLVDGDAAGDSDSRTFGFRWFAVDGVGRDAMFRLNGRRIVLRSAISWGFWPVNGIYPTPEWAERQVRIAKSYGLNMLNFHRAIGQPVVLDRADELGLLYYEEPGAYKSVTKDPLGLRIVREKLLRMVRRDRSHPSLVIYNLINEWDSRNPDPDPQEIDRHLADMAAARELDPSRAITHTSAWARGPAVEDPAKLHFRPFDATPHWNGWYDFHHAGGPAVWEEGLYRSPTDYHLYTDNAAEIVLWGEEGAISTPPRLQLIRDELAAAPRLGWDGAAYLEWFHAFDAFLDRKGLRGSFGDVDALTRSMGDVSLRHQGRRIENVRLGNTGDGYVINGWEAELIENHSGVVDCFRNPKGDPATIAYYNQPTYLAVKARNTVLQPPASIAVDCFAINETDLRGPHRLRLVAHDEPGNEIAATDSAVDLAGGDVYGQLLLANAGLAIPAGTEGRVVIAAELTNAVGEVVARGHDEAWAVDWRSAQIRGAGAVWESDGAVGGFLRNRKNSAVAEYADALGRLDWIVAARGPSEGQPVPVGAAHLRGPEGAADGVSVAFFGDLDFGEQLVARVEPTVALAVADGAAPDAAVPMTGGYSVRWTGMVLPPRSGTYVFGVRTTGAVRLVVAGQVLGESTPRARVPFVRGSVELVAGQPVPFAIEYRHGRGPSECALEWVVPDPGTATAANLLERVRRDGTTLVVLQQAGAWMELLAAMPDSGLRYDGSFKVGKAWLGGIHFVGTSPLFAGLPQATALDWPYQAVVRNGDQRTGLLLEGERFAAGCWHSYPMQLGTVVGEVPLGRGRVVFSTLDIAANLAAPPGPAEVARKLLCNFLEAAGPAGALSGKVGPVCDRFGRVRDAGVISPGVQSETWTYGPTCRRSRTGL